MNGLVEKEVFLLLMSICFSSNLFLQKLDIFPNVDEAKNQDLISQMTLTEKIYQLNAFYYDFNIYSNANLRLGIPNLIAGECLWVYGKRFTHIFTIPHFVKDLSWVKGQYQSVKGFISSEWKRENAKVTLNVTIPEGCRASIIAEGGQKTNVGAGNHQLEF